MKDFYSIEEFYRYKEMQKQSELCREHTYLDQKNMQYPAIKLEKTTLDTISTTKLEQMTLDTIPDEAIILIKKFDAFNPKIQTSYAGYNELEVRVPIWSRHMEKTLLYALTSGTAYTIEHGNIYIWYTPFKGLDGAGFYKLKRFVFLNDESTVKYFLDGNEKILNPL